MRIYKNNFNVVAYPVSSCKHCAFGTSTQKCYWVDVFKKYSFNCGGVTTNLTSDIFNL